MASYYGSNDSGGSSFHTQPNNRTSHIDEAKIFVGGLSWQTTEETLRYHFEQYGEVVSVEVMRDRQTGDPRGFAFIVFKSDDTVDLILKNKPHEINHKVVDVKRAQARGIAPPSIHGGQQGAGEETFQPHQPQRVKHEKDNLSPEEMQNKVFIGGLPMHVDSESLKDFFSVFGLVVDSIVMMDMVNQRSRGFGFVTFADGSGGAQKALEAQPINMFGKMVEVKLATPRGGGFVSNAGGGGGGGGGNFHRKPIMAPSMQSTGEFAGLASSYGRAGWRAGYGSKAFGKAGWSVVGWDDGGDAPDGTGFSFSMLTDDSDSRQSKRLRQSS